jgi:hypothetical protein
VGQAGAGNHNGQVDKKAHRSGQILYEPRRVTGAEPGNPPPRSTATTLTDPVSTGPLAARSDRCAGAARPKQGCRAAGAAAREHRVAPTDLPGSLQARRPGMASRSVPAHAPSPLGRGLPGHSCHHPGLAPQVGLAEMELLGTSPTRASPDRNSDQKTGDSHGSRQSHLGTSARARRTGLLSHHIAASTVGQILP